MAENTNTYVVDASFVLAFLLPDEKISIVEKMIERHVKDEIKLVSSYLLPFEVYNSLIIAVKRKRILLGLAQTLGKTFFDLEIKFEEIDFSKTLSTAQKHNLSFYDASYLSLSNSKKVPLLTLDTKLNNLKL